MKEGEEEIKKKPLKSPVFPSCLESILLVWPGSRGRTDNEMR